MRNPLRRAGLREQLGQGLAIRDDVVRGRHGDIPVRYYEPSSGATTDEPLVWVHGGGFVAGGLDQLESHAVACAIARSGRPVVAVCYRLARLRGLVSRPRRAVSAGVCFPVPLEDVVDAFTHVHERTAGTGAVLGGASAGACLSAASALRLQQEGLPGPTALVLAYGIFHASLPPASPALRSRTGGRHGVVQFRPGLVARMNRNYAGSPEALFDPCAFPGGHDVSGLPPTLAVDADRDALRASGELFAAELADAGVPVDHEVIAGTWHGFLDRPGNQAFDDAVDRITQWLALRPGPASGR